MEKTRLSNKGQVVIPKAVRNLYGWEAGLELAIVREEGGIRLKPIKPFRETTLEEVVGCVGYEGPRRSLEEMDRAIEKGAKERS